MEDGPGDFTGGGMRRSSKVVLAVAGLLALVLFAVYYPILASSQPEFTAQDARALLDDLSSALARKNEAAVLGHVAPDAVIAGHRVPEIRRLLRQAFASVRNLKVEFGVLAYKHSGDMVVLDVSVTAGEGNEQGKGVDEIYYSGPISFLLERRAVPHLFGLFTTYEWRITRLDAPNVPGW